MPGTCRQQHFNHILPKLHGNFFQVENIGVLRMNMRLMLGHLSDYTPCFASMDLMYSSTSVGEPSIFSILISSALMHICTAKALTISCQKSPYKIIGFLLGSWIHELIQVMPSSLSVPKLPLKTICKSVFCSITFVRSK